MRRMPSGLVAEVGRSAPRRATGPTQTGAARASANPTCSPGCRGAPGSSRPSSPVDLTFSLGHGRESTSRDLCHLGRPDRSRAIAGSGGTVTTRLRVGGSLIESRSPTPTGWAALVLGPEGLAREGPNPGQPLPACLKLPARMPVGARRRCEPGPTRRSPKTFHPRPRRCLALRQEPRAVPQPPGDAGLPRVAARASARAGGSKGRRRHRTGLARLSGCAGSSPAIAWRAQSPASRFPQRTRREALQCRRP